MLFCFLFIKNGDGIGMISSGVRKKGRIILPFDADTLLSRGGLVYGESFDFKKERLILVSFLVPLQTIFDRKLRTPL